MHNWFWQKQAKKKKVPSCLWLQILRQPDVNATEVGELFGWYLVSRSVFSRTAWAMVSASWYFFLLLVSSFTESCSSAWMAVSCSMHWRRATIEINRKLMQIHIQMSLKPLRCEMWWWCSGNKTEAFERRRGKQELLCGVSETSSSNASDWSGNKLNYNHQAYRFTEN